MLSILWIVLIVIASLVFSNVYWSCVLYTLCCQFSGLSLFWLPLWYSLTFIGPVSCIPYVVNSLDCPYLIASLVFSNVYLSCVLYTLCCQFSGLSLLWLPLWYSLTFICPVSCIPYVVNSLVLIWLPLWYSLTFIVLCLVYLMLSILWIVLIASLVFSIYWSCVLYTLCCQFSGLSLLWLPLWYSLTFICPVSCIPYVVNSLDCPYCDCLFGIL